MSKDIEKYTNWRAITESDYVTMFIKTWFAFVATLRSLYPDIDVFAADGKPRGDRPFTQKLKEADLIEISKLIKIEDFVDVLVKVYNPSREKIANAPIFTATMVLPTGVPARMEMMMPPAAQKTDNTAAHTVTERKLRNKRIAERAGKITSAEISREPTRFIASTMITAMITAIIRL